MRPTTFLRRALGALLVAAAYLPAHRLLDPAATGAAGAETRAVGDALWVLLASGTVLAAAVAFGLARLFPRPSLAARLARAADRLVALPASALAAATGSIALVLAGAAALLLFRRLPTLADAMVQLLQARGWAEGALAAPTVEPLAARAVQNGWWTPLGWASIYPPGHTALLAVGFRLSAPWIVGPLCTAATAALTALAARRLLPERPRAAALGGLLAGLSPFLLLLGSGYLSHASAAAAGALALYAAVRARDEGAAWALVAGAATGAMVTSRPWAGIVLGAIAPALWIASARGKRPSWLGGRAALWIAGGLPFALALAWYDARLFGAPLRLGYDAAFGPAHGLGLHRDPWGNAYGLREALAYTGFDLLALGSHLLELPVSVVAVVGAWLIAARRLPRGAGVLLAWALLPALGNALYWHHGYHLGPRMLFEAAPAWCVLAVVAWTELARLEGRAGAFFLWLAVVSVPAALLLDLPQRLAASRWSGEAVARATVPAAPDGSAALVFVHGSWPGRVAARLAGAGMRRDSIETALRRNDLCRVDVYARALEESAAEKPPLDFAPLPGSPPQLQSYAVAPGVFARIDPSLVPDPYCRREASADQAGTVELEPLAWQTSIPGVGDGTPLLFRDLGPLANASVLARYPDRSVWIEVVPGELVEYRVNELVMWGGALAR